MTNAEFKDADKQAQVVDEESPVFQLPEDPEWQDLLRQKLSQYEERLASREFGYMPPELREINPSGYAKRILQEVLKGGPVKTFDLGRDLYHEQPSFHLNHFERACAVVDAYLTNKQVLVDSVQRVKENPPLRH